MPCTVLLVVLFVLPWRRKIDHLGCFDGMMVLTTHIKINSSFDKIFFVALQVPLVAERGHSHP